MSTEVIANLWAFVRQPYITELGVRLYNVDGDDDEKTEFLKALAPYDFWFAARFPIPEDLKGVKVQGLETAFGGVNYLDYFRETWDPIKESLPMHAVGISGNATAFAPLETSNLLQVYTAVEIDSAGNHRANVPNAIGKSTLLLNYWAFADANSSKEFAVAGRPYMASGSTAQLNSILKKLAPDDYLLSTRSPVPATDQSSNLLSKQSICDIIVQRIEEHHPETQTGKFAFQPDDALVHSTVVAENDQGKTGLKQTTLAKKKQMSWWKRLFSPAAIPPSQPKKPDSRTNWSIQEYAQAIADKVSNATPCEDSGLESHQTLVRQLGDEINEKYGFKGMQEVWHAIHRAMGPGPCSDLTRIWDGVGQWQK